MAICKKIAYIFKIYFTFNFNSSYKHMTYFSDFFNVQKVDLDNYGAFDISLINDLPLFIDPFLLYGSEKKEYEQLHEDILKYLSFLRDKAKRGRITDAEIQSWYTFSEVKQNWLGFSVSGNSGTGLGGNFGRAMSDNMHLIFDDLNKEEVTDSSHLEKAALFQIGIGKDNVSDFTCNLIKSYLLEYTQNFTRQFIAEEQTREFNVAKAYFNYDIERWMAKKYKLPVFNNDYVILTPREILTKDDNWINSNELRGDFVGICDSIPNKALRSEIQAFYKSKLPAPTFTGKGRKKKQKKVSKEDIAKAVNSTILKFPDIIKYYIKSKENDIEGAQRNSEIKVDEVETLFREQLSQLIEILYSETDFYETEIDSYEEAMKRVEFLKDVIENKDGYKLFYLKGEPIKREADLQVIYRLTWYSTPLDVNREVNNGRGPVDYSISYGAKNKTLVEFKLASNSKLKMNLKNQVEIYKAASDTKKSIKVILYFDSDELKKVNDILGELDLQDDKSIIMIDSGDNKPSASNVK